MTTIPPADKHFTKDLILQEQVICQMLTSPQLKYLTNDTYSTLLRLLRGPPKTVEDLIQEYEQISEFKSNKTIYRNLTFLVKEGLVIRIGKRVISHPDQRISSFTLYARSAKFYLNDVYIQLLQNPSQSSVSPPPEAHHQVSHIPPQIKNLSEDDGLRSDLEQKFKILHFFLNSGLETTVEYPQFKAIIEKIFLQKELVLTALMKRIPVEKMTLFQDLDWLELNQVMEASLWLQVIVEHSELLQSFKKLF